VLQKALDIEIRCPRDRPAGRKKKKELRGGEGASTTKENDQGKEKCVPGSGDKIEPRLRGGTAPEDSTPRTGRQRHLKQRKGGGGRERCASEESQTGRRGLGKRSAGFGKKKDKKNSENRGGGRGGRLP